MFRPSRTIYDSTLASPFATRLASEPQWMVNEKRARIFKEAGYVAIARRLLSLAPLLYNRPLTFSERKGAADQKESADIASDLPSPCDANEFDQCGLMPDLISAHMLHCAYKSGLMPDYFAMQKIWSSPLQRSVYNPALLTTPAQQLKQNSDKNISIKFDENFEDVMLQCAHSLPFQGHNLWLTEDMKHHIATLYDLGLAHSFSLYSAQGHFLAGGIGISIGHIFIIETILGRKEWLTLSLTMLNDYLAKHKYRVVDVTRVKTSVPFTALEVMRDEYINYLSHLGETDAKKWRTPRLEH